MSSETYLSTAWANFKGPIESEVPGWLRGKIGEAIKLKFPNKVAAPISTQESLDIEISDLEEIEKITNIVNKNDGNYVSEIAAWYAPYIFHGANWGIYLREEAIIELAVKTSIQMKKKNIAIHFDILYDAVRQILIRHELGHFSMELFGASLYSTSGNTSYTSTFHKRTNVEEPICTAHEMHSQTFKTALHSTLRNHEQDLANAWKTIPLPVPYSDYNKYDVENIQGYNSLSKEMLGNTEANWLLDHYFKHGFRIKKEVPVYLVPISISISSAINRINPRITKLDAKKVIKHAKKCQRNGKPVGIEVRTGKQHPYTIFRSGHKAVDIDTTKWDQADYRVVKVLAELFELTHDEYCTQVMSV